VSAFLPAVDLADSATRRWRGLEYLPPYSARIRAAGIEGQFGGRDFVLGGQVVAEGLVEFAGLKSTDHVLEVGCGAGRTAFELVNILEHGNFVGMDIDWPQLAACRSNQTLADHGFRFVFADIQSDLYNRRGVCQASTFRFPFDDNQFDVAFLMSVFTHMLSDECENYAHEIMRVLAPGGRAVVSAFLHDAGFGTSPSTFSQRQGNVWVQFPDNPRKAISQDLQVLDGWFGQAADDRLLGTWRGTSQSRNRDYQDWLIWTKREGS
jgi:SAM-dependent methyltransferase